MSSRPPSYAPDSDDAWPVWQCVMAGIAAASVGAVCMLMLLACIVRMP